MAGFAAGEREDPRGHERGGGGRGRGQRHLHGGGARGALRAVHAAPAARAGWGAGAEQSYAFLVYGAKLTAGGRRAAEDHDGDHGRLSHRGARHAPARPRRAAGRPAERVPELPGRRPPGARRAPARRRATMRGGSCAEDPGLPAARERACIGAGSGRAPVPPRTAQRRRAGGRLRCGSPADVYRGRTILCPPGDDPALDGPDARSRCSPSSATSRGVSFLDLFSGIGDHRDRGGLPRRRARAPGGEGPAEEGDDTEEHPLRGEPRSTSSIAPVERFLRTNQRSWDIVFLDPPFDFEGKGAVLDAACAAAAPRRRRAGHHPPAHGGEAPDRAAGLELADRREYGQSLLLFFRRAARRSHRDAVTRPLDAAVRLVGSARSLPSASGLRGDSPSAPPSMPAVAACPCSSVGRARPW